MVKTTKDESVTDADAEEREQEAGRLLEEVSAEEIFTWECTSFTEDGLGFKMGFKNPMEVSKNNKNPDKLVIQLKKNTFYARGTNEPLSGKLEIKFELPKQFPSLTEKMMTEAMAGGIKSILTGLFGLGLLA